MHRTVQTQLDNRIADLSPRGEADTGDTIVAGVARPLPRTDRTVGAHRRSQPPQEGPGTDLPHFWPGSCGTPTHRGDSKYTMGEPEEKL
ncbi:hypothetical protein QNO09_34940 [Streptomyces sp. 378]|uniref:hypothetical protein n=1 Tax=Streptomyces sp. 378 TaxID=3049412 RepID=UPI0024C28C6F|nr:hypothetical protein [Streptomyces sp. 378]MDK1348378.1 hypothetical protein [Streptomyces sp. 378]